MAAFHHAAFNGIRMSKGCAQRIDMRTCTNGNTAATYGIQQAYGNVLVRAGIILCIGPAIAILHGSIAN